MTVELLQTLSLVAYIAAAVLLLAGVALFFLLDVPKLYGEVSGRTAKKAIEEIRRQNENAGNKTRKPISSGGGTEKFATADLMPQPSETTRHYGQTDETTLLSEQSNETTVLSEQSNETTLLSEQTDETTLLVEQSGETAQLPEQTNETTVLPENFAVDVEMGFLGSSEMIE